MHASSFWPSEDSIAAVAAATGKVIIRVCCACLFNYLAVLSKPVSLLYVHRAISVSIGSRCCVFDGRVVVSSCMFVVRAKNKDAPRVHKQRRASNEVTAHVLVLNP